MEIDEIDWMLVAVVILTAIASLVKEVCEFIGVETVGWLILLLKAIAAVLGVIYAIWKFFRLKPYRIKIEPNEWKENPKGGFGREYIYTIPRNIHRKGSTPSISTNSIQPDGSISAVITGKVVEENGDIKLYVNNLQQLEYDLFVIIKA